MSDVVEIQVGERQFRLKPLKLMPQMKGWAIISQVLIPAFVGLESGAIGPQTLAGVERLPELYALYAAEAQVCWDGKWVPLKTFEDNVFLRRSDLLLAFVAEATHAEYGSFLDERGKTVLAATVNRLRSLLASTGKSGE